MMLLVRPLKEVLPRGHNLHQVVFGEMLKKQRNLLINQIILTNLQETIAMKTQMILHVHKLPLRLLKVEYYKTKIVMTTLMPLDVLKVVGRKVKNHLQWVRAMNHLLVEKIILLVGIYLLVNSKMKKIVQIIQLHQDVNLRTMNKNRLQWVMAMNHLQVKLLLVMKNYPWLYRATSW